MIFSWSLSDKILPPLFSRPATTQQAYPSGTLTFLSHAPRASTLPVSFPFLSPVLENSFVFKNQNPSGRNQASRPSLSMDTAIRIVLHSAEVVRFLPTRS